jgi:hypothetical protein
VAFCYFDEIVQYIKDHSDTDWNDTDLGKC